MIKVLQFDYDLDHHKFTREQLRSLADDIIIEHTGSATTAEEEVKSGQYGCLLTDDQLPDNAGTRLVAKLREDGFLTPVVILSDALDDESEGFTTGAYADDEFNVVIKFFRFDLLNKWIHLLTDRYNHFQRRKESGTDISDSAREDTEKLESIRESLTNREREILSLIADGKSNKDIAVELGISYWTVINHVHNLYVKLDIHSRSEAIRIGLSLKNAGEQ